MLDYLLRQLCEELGLERSVADENKQCPLTVGNISIVMQEFESGIYLYSAMGSLPSRGREDFFISLMKANFLGQGTGGGVIGLKEDESGLTFSLRLPSDVKYKVFKDGVEEFTNYIDYWDKAIKKMKAELESSITK